MDNEETNLSAYLKKLNLEKDEKQKRDSSQDKRLTIILSEYDYNRLNYMAKFFATLPSVFARELLVHALKDSENISGISEEDHANRG